MSDIQLDQSKIDRLIRPILGGFDDSEDSYQDVQLRILERLPRSEEEIKAIAQEVKKKHTKDYLYRKHRLKSLYEPIGNHGSEEYTFENILADKDTAETEEGSNAVEPSARLILNFLVKELVDGKSLNWSILSLLRKSSELLKRHHRKWEKWEDDIIREKYIRGGCLAVALFLNRTVNAIASRASYLGIRRYPEKHWIPQEDSKVQGKRRLERERSKEQRRLESQCVKEERLRVKEKRWLEWKRIMRKHARIKEHKIRLKIEQIKFKIMQLILREKRRIERGTRHERYLFSSVQDAMWE